MIKQHCDICDGVIPNTEGYRTIHFGRGQNTDVNTGYDPLVVCKNCWRKMLDAVGGDDLYRDIDNRPKRNGDSVDTLIKEILPIKEDDGKSCKSCKFKDKYIGEDPCLSCSAHDKWEAMDHE